MALAIHSCHGPPLLEEDALTPGTSSREQNGSRPGSEKVLSLAPLSASLHSRHASAPEAAAQGEQSDRESASCGSGGP